jgi:hypothetical protein
LLCSRVRESLKKRGCPLLPNPEILRNLALFRIYDNPLIVILSDMQNAATVSARTLRICL